MTLAQLRERTAQLLDYDADSIFGAGASGSTLDPAVNWGQDMVSLRLYLYSGNVTLTTSGGVGTYDAQGSSFSKRMLTIDRVVIGGTILRNSRGEYGMYRAGELEAWYPTWRTATSGVPEAACFMSPNLVLTPAPSSMLSNCFVQGRVLADSLTASGQECELPVEVHEFIPLLAAYFAQSPVVDTEEGWKRVTTFKSNAGETLDQLFAEMFRAVHGRLPFKNDPSGN